MPEPADLPPIPTQTWLRPELLRSWGEFVAMTAFVLFVPIASSTHGALHGSSKDFAQILASNTELIRTTAWEATFLSFFVLYLAWRGWKPADLRIRPSLVTTAEGCGLYVVGHIAILVTFIATVLVAYGLQPGHLTFTQFLYSLVPHIPAHSLHISSWVIIFSMVLNAFFEEITCMGYIFTQLAARRGPAVALVGTVFLRVACHTYQDPFHVAGIAVLFTLYALVYIYTRKLWPLIFAHLVLDIISFSALKHIGG